MKKDKIFIGVVCAALCEVLFGFSYLFTKDITNSVSPMALLSWRFMVAFLVINLCIPAGIIKLDFKQKSVSSLFWIGILQPVLYFIGETVGIKLTTASESGAFIASVPIAALLFSALILKEPPTKLQAVGVAVTTIGILIIVLAKGLDATFNPVGYLMLLLAVVSYSLYSVYAQKAVTFTSVEKTYVMMGFGAIVFTSIALVENATAGTLMHFFLLPFTSMKFVGAILYLSIGCSIIAFLLINTAIDTIGTNRTASFVGVCTVVTVIAGVILLKESYSIFQGVGTVLVLGGVYLANVILKKNAGEGQPQTHSGERPKLLPPVDSVNLP